MSVSHPEALSVVAAAKMAGISRTKLYEVITSGELPSFKIGRRRMVRPSAIKDWLDRLEAGGASPRAEA